MDAPFSFTQLPKRTCGGPHDQRLLGLCLGDGAHACVLGVGLLLRPQRGVLKPPFAFVPAVCVCVCVMACGSERGKMPEARRKADKRVCQPPK